jgi:hypothetical protein
MHPCLQYTDQDGIYVNPKSFDIATMWCFYSPKYNCWFRTPYENHETWMSISSIIVKSGCYKDRVPALINVEIIEYLRENNPIPSDAIIHVASEAEDQILKL